MTYTYKYNRVYLAIYKKDSSIGIALVDIAFLQGEEADKLANQLAEATEQQKQEILSQYDY